MYKLKTIPEDFIVEEITKAKPEDTGQYALYKLTKRDLTTIDATKKISQHYKTPIKYINFAGTKDKIAITTQYITISKGAKKDYKTKNLILNYLGQTNNRLNLGELLGNKFTITVRNIEQPPKLAKQIPNYFDDQRFGNNKNNHIIGKHLVKKDFRSACELIEQTQHHLIDKPADYVGALRTLPKQNLKMYVHAYQSYLFNETVKKLITKHKTAKYALGELYFPTTKIDNQTIELIGFESENKLLEDEGITPRDFIFAQLPQLTSPGTTRELLITIKDLTIGQLQPDEFSKNKKCTVKFTLNKGSYATIVIKALMLQ
ncbi:tRNA pseudouridine(13) synthase TruD [Candidatus Woesearchaeota archaeon]|nr:tRNA pseudouridine(13) synthase TruD [Candidatus Woesearchaeota archaeon]